MEQPAERIATLGAGVPLTFVVGRDHLLRLASRHSEHVELAAGEAVEAAGEITFDVVDCRISVIEASNQSTGFCPEPTSWDALAAALDNLGVERPDAFTNELTFRRCEQCGEPNVVKDDGYVCAVCDSELPVT